ncbi:MAG: LamG domain-containing protein, partial [Candidatus Izemoplasmatales bacterium]
EVNDYVTTCPKDNETKEECVREKTGSHFEEREVWLPLGKVGFSKSEVITIGIFTDVKKGDYVEWIPKMFGERLTAWASWTESLNTDLVSYWNFDEQDTTGSGTIIDIHGTNNGTNNGASNVTGILGTAYDFEESEGDSMVLGAVNPALFSVSMWIKPESFDNDFNNILSTRDGTTGGYAFYIDDDTPFVLRAYTFSGITTITPSTESLIAGEWYHAVMTYNGSVIKLYINGVLNNTGTQAYTQSNKNITLGSDDANTGDDFYDGIIDEVGIWSRALTSDEVSDLYNGGDGLPYGGGISLVTLNAPVNYFNTTNSYIPLNCSATYSTRLSYIVDGVEVSWITNSTPDETLTYDAGIIGASDGTYNWTCNSTMANGTVVTATPRYFTVDTIDPIVNIISPSGALDYGYSNKNETLNFTATDDNLDSCWYYLGLSKSCYQESANLSNQSGIDGNCNLNYTGDYSEVNTGCEKWRDGIWGEDDAANYCVADGNTPFDIRYFYVNYTKPENMYNATWQIERGLKPSIYNEIVNKTIPPSCLNYNKNDLILRVYSFYASAISKYNLRMECFDGSWQEIYYVTPVNNNWITYLYEEAIYWDVWNKTDISNCSEPAYFNLTDSRTLTLYANDSSGNIGYDTSTWSYLITQNLTEYNENVYETSNERFNLSINLDGAISSTGYIYYNNVAYPASSNCDDDGCNLSATLDIPLVTTGTSQNYTAYWYATIYTSNDSLIINTSNNAFEQNVSRIYLEECGDYTIETLNFTLFDEQNLTQITSWDFDATFDYWLGGGTVARTSSFENDSITDINICLGLNETFRTNATIDYQDNEENYKIRNYYFQNGTLTNETQEIKLYDLLATEAVSFVLEVQNPKRQSIADALIFIQRYYPEDDITRTVQIAKTDANGESVGFFETETAEYKFLIVKNNQVLLSTDLQKVVPKSTPYTLVFTTTGLDTDFTKLYGLNNLFTNLSYNKDTEIISFTYIDTSGSLSVGRLTVWNEKYASENILICNTSSIQPSSTITCNISSYNGTFIAEGSIGRSPEIITDIINIAKALGKEIFGDTGKLLGWFLILVGALVSLWNKVAAIWTTNAMIILVNMIGLIAFTPLFVFGAIFLGVILTIVLKN